MADKTVAVISDGAWLANTAYHVGDTVSNDTLKIYKCITAGTSASSGGPTGTGTDITDNTAHWAYQETVSAAYTSLNAAFSGESGALPGIVTFHGFNFEDTTAADTGTGYSDNDATHYIKVVAYDSHDGKISANAFRIVSSTDGIPALAIREDYTQCHGIQVTHTGEYNTRYAIITYANIGILYKNCIAKIGGTNGNNSNAFALGSDTTKGQKLINCVAINPFNVGFEGGTGASASVVFYNCTTSGCLIGFNGYAGRAIIKNCVAHSCTTEDFHNAMFDSASTNNASSDGTAYDTNEVDLSGKLLSELFVDAANGDYHLISGSALIGVGINLYNDSDYPFQDDIDGDDRGGAAASWDIGADEYVSGVIAGTTCWGHSTAGDITETNIRTFASNWTGTGSITGSGDSEKLKLSSGQYMESEIVETGEEEIELTQNVYETGDDVTLSYKNGATVEDCNADSWHEYSVPFDSTGYVKVKASAA